MVNCSIQDHVSNEFGGSVFLSDIENYIEFREIIIKDSKTLVNGGGMFLSNIGDLVFNKTEIKNCTSNERAVSNTGGGGIYMSDIKNITMVDC